MTKMIEKYSEEGVEAGKTFADIIAEYGLNQEQINILQDFSKKRTTTRFERLMAEEIGDPEMIKDFRYCGYYDAGYYGAGKCSVGHKLRYVHIAKNVHTDEEIKFGILCVTDFFKLTPLALKLIKQGFYEANKEITQSLEKFIEHGSFEKYNEKTDIVKKLEAVIEYANDRLPRPFYDTFEEMFTIGTMQSFLEMKIPVPDWFEFRVNEIYKDVQVMLRNKPVFEKLERFETEEINISNDLREKIHNRIEFLKTRLATTTSAINGINKIVNTDWNSAVYYLEQIDESKLQKDQSNEVKHIKDTLYTGVTEEQLSKLKNILAV